MGALKMATTANVMTTTCLQVNLLFVQLRALADLIVRDKGLPLENVSDGNANPVLMLLLLLSFKILNKYYLLKYFLHALSHRIIYFSDIYFAYIITFYENIL